MSINKITSLDDLLREAVRRGGTDLHLATGARPKVRIMGDLVELDYEVITDLTASNLFLPMLDALDRRSFDSNGQIDTSYTLNGVGRFRINLFKQKGASSGVFRVLPNAVPDYADLGLPMSTLHLATKKRGLVLITGATGSGKSTTLAAFIKYINDNQAKHIVTLEDPIEYLHWHKRSIVSQREVGKDVKTFNDGLRAALREDPDVILVGEMRDRETMEIALQAAETGHLVLSTLHTIGASESVLRILDSFPVEAQAQIRSQLALTLEGVISQQLLPTSKGYVLGYEILYKTKVMQEYIRNNDIYGLTEYLGTTEAMDLGMCKMDYTLLELASDGKISRDTAVSYAIDSRKMSAML